MYSMREIGVETRNSVRMIDYDDRNIHTLFERPTRPAYYNHIEIHDRIGTFIIYFDGVNITEIAIFAIENGLDDGKGVTSGSIIMPINVLP